MKVDIEKFINDQLSVWPLACGNFRALRDVRTKTVMAGGLEVILQHNPARIVSSAAKVDPEAVKRRKCFLCSSNRPPEQFSLDFEGRKGRKYDILLNPYPIFRNHLVIAMKEHTPQSIWRRYVDMLDISRALPGFTVFYNGPECGASAPDHHHFQAASKGQMPLENDIDTLFGNLAAARPVPEDRPVAQASSPLRRLASNLDAELFLYDKYLPGIFAIRGTASKSVAKLFYRLLDCAGYCMKPSAQTFTEPECNVFVWYASGEFRSVVVFRSAHRSHHYFSEGEDHLTVSPGCADMAGCLVVPVAGEFEKAESAAITELLTEVALDRETGKMITDRLTRTQKEISVGIMSAPEIVFEILSDGAGPRKAKYNDGKIEYDGSLYDELFFEAKTLSTMFAEPSFRLFGVTIGVGFHWERQEEQQFAGALKIIVEEDRLTAVNVIGMEDYLVSVISSEMKSTAPPEFLKAHAVISRSWIVRRMLRTGSGAACGERKEGEKKEPGDETGVEEMIRWYGSEAHRKFDVCADDHCQRYQGLTRAADPTAKCAVDETWGQILTYGGEVCDTRFSKCCGGMTERFGSCWEDRDYDYLQAIPDPFCGRATDEILKQVLNSYDLETADWYRWQVEYTREELSALFAARSGIDIGEITALIPLERGASGRIVRLEVVGTLRSVIIGKELEIRRLLSPTHLKSSAFTVGYLPSPSDSRTSSADTPAFLDSPPTAFSRIRLTGSGWGHGVGLCQIGAAVMASEGRTYEDILEYYYPGSHLTVFVASEYLPAGERENNGISPLK